jgi:DNA polymerase V
MLAVVAERPAPPTPRPSREPDLRPGGVPEPSHGTGWPLLATPVPAGFPAPADDAVEHCLSLDEHLIRNAESTFLLRVAGDALAEAGIHDGDLLVVDRAVPPLAGSVVVAVVAGAFALRRLERDAGGRLALQAAGPDLPDGPLSEGQDLVLWGVVRWAVHRVWPGRER